MTVLLKPLVYILKKLDLGSAIAVRLTKITGKSKEPLHPKHFLTQKPWFTKYIENKDIVLDLGCGNGQSSIKVAKVAKRVIGVDINNVLLNIGQKTVKDLHMKNINFDKLDLEKKLKFKNRTFDKIIFLDVLEHLRKREQILKEIKRILKPQGKLFLGVPNSQTSWKKLQRSVNLCSFSDPDHKTEFSERSIKNLLKKHNFKIVSFQYGKYDTPLRGFFDVIGAISLPFYRKISNWRQEKAEIYPKEASGFEIVATNNK